MSTIASTVSGNVSQDGGKQTDPVNFSRAEDPSRSGLFGTFRGW